MFFIALVIQSLGPAKYGQRGWCIFCKPVFAQDDDTVLFNFTAGCYGEFFNYFYQSISLYAASKKGCRFHSNHRTFCNPDKHGRIGDPGKETLPCIDFLLYKGIMARTTIYPHYKGFFFNMQNN